jgi:hypothetical protein
MDYNQLDVFLEKFKKILNQASFQKEAVLSIISKEIKHEIKPENIKIKNTTIELLGMSPVLKNEIFLHKEKILKQFKEEGITILNLR